MHDVGVVESNRGKSSLPERRLIAGYCFKGRRLFPKISEPACFDSEEVALIDSHRYILVLLCDKEHVIDELSGHDLSLFPAS